MSSARILLVTDDAVLRRTLAELLAAAGHQVVSAADLADLAVADEALADALDIPVLRLGTSPGAIPKPVRPGTLLARVAQALARENRTLRLGAWLLDAAAGVLIDQDGRKIRLTAKETAILECLYRAEGPVPRQQLLAEVWGYSAQTDTHTVETHIYRLRRKVQGGAPLLVTQASGYGLAR